MFNLVTSTSRFGRRRRRRRRRRLWVFPEANLLLYTVCMYFNHSIGACVLLSSSFTCMFPPLCII